MKYFFSLLVCFFALSAFSQEDKELYSDGSEDYKDEASDFQKHLEIGTDVYFSASTFGGSAGLGLKLAIVQTENVAFGPSVRWNYTYYKQFGASGSNSVYGGGAFIHGRFMNYLFAGLEFEVLNTPFVNGTVATGPKKWIPTALIGGGFSHAFGAEQHFRLQAGVMYDVINNPNSPLRYGYFMHKENGTLIPVLYRIAFFFTI